MSLRPVKIFFDGGCRPNPGRMEIAVAWRGRVFIDRDAGPGDSMAAEWLALLAALRVAIETGTDFVLLGDALAVIDQVNGRTRPSGAGVQHLAAARALAGDFRIRHIKRTQNLAGIALVRLDRR